MVAGLVLSACGTTPGDRAVSGGLLGAGTGAAIGAAGRQPRSRRAHWRSWRGCARRRDQPKPDRPWSSAMADGSVSVEPLLYIGLGARCSYRYRSFDPVSGTYLGYDGHRPLLPALDRP
jgi:hypothetical protein